MNQKILIKYSFLTFVLFFLMNVISNNLAKADKYKNAWQFKFNEISGGIIDFSEFKGKVIFVVNTASFCGFTSQYKNLQKLWDDNKHKDFILIGIPSNDFGQQEYDNNSKTKNFCETNFSIDFPLTEITKIKGNNAHPFYLWAKKELGLLAFPKWNFHKYVISKDGNLTNWFSSVTSPNSGKIVNLINSELQKIY